MRTAGRDHVRRLLGLVVLCAVLLVSLSGCVRIHAALAVSSDDLISGELVIAALPVSKDDDGPSLTVPPELAEKVRTEPYTADGYVGQKVTLTGLRFTELHAARRLDLHAAASTGCRSAAPATSSRSPARST